VVPPEHAARVGIGRRLKGDAIEPMPTVGGLPQARPASVVDCRHQQALNVPTAA